MIQIPPIDRANLLWRQRASHAHYEQLGEASLVKLVRPGGKDVGKTEACLSGHGDDCHRRVCISRLGSWGRGRVCRPP
jgi:hypothetical protein